MRKKSKELFHGRHFVFYARGKYSVNNPMEDLKRLVADYSDWDFESVTDWDVFRHVCNIVIPLLLESENPQKEIERLLGSFLTKVLNGVKLNTEDIVIKLFSFLTRVKTMDGDKVIINLGEPDYNILPAP